LSGEYVTVGTTVKRELYEKFRIWCAQHGTIPSHVLRRYIESLVGELPNIQTLHERVFQLESALRRLQTEVLQHDVYIYEIAKKTGVNLEEIAKKYFRTKPLPEE